MKTVFKLTFILASVVSLLALSTQTAMAKVDVKPSRDLHFDDALVKGKYHEGGDGLAIIENEKNLNQILFVKKSFRDRTKELAEKRTTTR